MFPSNPSFDCRYQGLMDLKIICYLLLGFAAVYTELDQFYSFLIKPPSIAETLGFVLAIVFVGSAIPMGRITAQAVIACVQYVKRIWIESIMDVPSSPRGWNPSLVDSYATAQRFIGVFFGKAARRCQPWPTFVRASLVNLLPKSLRVLFSDRTGDFFGGHFNILAQLLASDRELWGVRNGTPLFERIRI
jgi:hypothetical protein